MSVKHEFGFSFGNQVSLVNLNSFTEYLSEYSNSYTIIAFPVIVLHCLLGDEVGQEFLISQVGLELTV